MIAYKFTNQKMQTCNDTQWELHEWKETSGEGDLCSCGWLHYYSDPLLAAFLNPIHAKFAAPRLFEIEIAEDAKILEDHGLKLGCTKMRLTKELEIPAVTLVLGVTLIIPIGGADMPVVSALIALSQHQAITGKDFLNALVLGVETECRLGK